MVNDIGVNAIWFDHAVSYYSEPNGVYSQGVGKVVFNQMMQTLHRMFPGVIFFLNVSDVHYHILQCCNDDWLDSTYVLPTLSKGFNVDMGTVEVYNEYYPLGHVILHFDATAEGTSEPMGRFSNFTAKQEVSYISFFLGHGLNANLSINTYNLLIPVIGGPTCVCQYGTRGNLYNGLNVGFDSRGTFESFITAMKPYHL
jgi:hypothetical protein